MLRSSSPLKGKRGKKPWLTATIQLNAVLGVKEEKPLKAGVRLTGMLSILIRWLSEHA
jgi:hypothetical protein